MISYRLNEEGDFAQQLLDGVPTGVWANTATNADYLAWLAEGNQPLPWGG